MGTEKQRLRILGTLKSAFIAAALKDKGLVRNEIISQLCMDYGVMKSKAEEYIQVLLDGHFIVEDEFGLWLSNNVPPAKVNEKEDLKADEILEKL